MSGRKLLYRLYHVFWLGIDLLLPPTCGGCGTPGFRWCHECESRVRQLPMPLCEICGTPVSAECRRCAACSTALPRYRALRSLAAFDAPIRPALHRLKYRHDMGLGEALTPQLIDFVAGLKWPVDMLTPVPLGRSRFKERGYNQAGLISWPLSLALGIAYTPQALTRTRETRTQVGLTREERRENVHGAFQANPGLVRDRTILLVDDVATTGATLSSCAEALHAAGARDVFALTVARVHQSLAGAA